MQIPTALILLAVNMLADELPGIPTLNATSLDSRIPLPNSRSSCCRTSTREYPNKLDHVLNGPPICRNPATSILFSSAASIGIRACTDTGCLRRCCAYSRHAEAREIEKLFDSQLTPRKWKGEIDYLDQPLRATFERPYGWAWLLMLARGAGAHI